MLFFTKNLYIRTSKPSILNYEHIIINSGYYNYNILFYNNSCNHQGCEQTQQGRYGRLFSWRTADAVVAFGREYGGLHFFCRHPEPRYRNGSRKRRG